MWIWESVCIQRLLDSNCKCGTKSLNTISHSGSLPCTQRARGPHRAAQVFFFKDLSWDSRYSGARFWSKSLSSAYDMCAYLLLKAIRPSDEKVQLGGSLDAFRKDYANAGIQFPLHPSSLHIHHSYTTPQYNTYTQSHTVILNTSSHLLHIILQYGPQKFCMN